ncbi:hypothetical protein ACFYXM_21875 [Streptomyces sp. NPDC002476]|uniref:hypothetical protein n=1 Tax=Streptomyces sp. NPDC002476 TaxID=3364648 RepID=UPI0036A31A4C
MRGHGLRNTVVLCAASALAVAAVPTAAPAASPVRSSSQSPTARAVAVDCFSHARVRPGDFLLACGDGNNRLVSLRWTHWGPSSAVGTGLDAVNDCRPYCAAGTFHTYPVEVRLDRPTSWQQDPGIQRFTRLRLVYTDGVPAQAHRVTYHTLWD